jgi:hypothetical protein
MTEVAAFNTAWAAGVFDHGGYVKGKNRTLYLRVPFPFDGPKAMRFRETLGIGKVYGPYRRGRRLEWQYELTGRAHVFKVLVMLYPYLTRPCRYEGLLDSTGSSVREASSYLYKEEAEFASAVGLVGSAIDSDVVSGN